MAKTTTERPELKLIAHWIAAMLLIVDMAMILGLGFEYVLPVLMAVPELQVIETLGALGTIAFLLFVQLLFLPLIAFLFDFPPDQL